MIKARTPNYPNTFSIRVVPKLGSYFPFLCHDSAKVTPPEFISPSVDTPRVCGTGLEWKGEGDEDVGESVARTLKVFLD